VLIFVVAIPVSFGFLPGVQSDTAAAPGLRANRIVLFRATPFEVRPGSTITLDGSGFSRTFNKVYFDGEEPVTAISTTGVSMKVVVPRTLSNGEHQISVTNSFGSSENPSQPILIKVTDTPSPPPVILSASVSGDVVTLVGQGFSSSNSIFTSLGNTSSPSFTTAQGGVLTFRVSDLSMYQELKASFSSEGPHDIALWVYVQGEHGANKDPYKVDITI